MVILEENWVFAPQGGFHCLAEDLSYGSKCVKGFYTWQNSKADKMDHNTGKRLNTLAQLLPSVPGCYLVGGAVRDCLLGKIPVDLDIVTSEYPGKIAHAIGLRYGRRVICLQQKSYQLFRIVTPEFTFDVTALTGPDIESDLQQRDFTINAMGYDLSSRRLVDIFDSRADLEQGVVRMTSPGVFGADPLRLLRAFRIAACLAFSISGQTLETISENSTAIESVAGERVHLELFRMLAEPKTASLLRLMQQTGLLNSLFPELAILENCPPAGPHNVNCLEHSMKAYAFLEQLLADPLPWLEDWHTDIPAADHPLYVVLKLSTLLHDIGKPVTIKQTKGKIDYHGHQEAGARTVPDIAQRLRFSKQEQNDLEFLILHHMHLFHLFQLDTDNNMSKRAIGRLLRLAGKKLPCLVFLFAADSLAKNPGLSRSSSKIAPFCRRLHQNYKSVASKRARIKPLISGHDLIEHFGLQPSALFKTILDQVNDLHLGGVLTTRREALNWVADELKKHNF